MIALFIVGRDRKRLPLCICVHHIQFHSRSIVLLVFTGRSAASSADRRFE